MIIYDHYMIIIWPRANRKGTGSGLWRHFKGTLRWGAAPVGFGGGCAGGLRRGCARGLRRSVMPGVCDSGFWTPK